MSDDLKRQAAAAALGEVRPGMRLGLLGSGTTAWQMVELLAAQVEAGLEIVGVPTSEATTAQARALGIPLSDLDATPELDLTIDGADEIGPGLALIKGGGAALLRERSLPPPEADGGDRRPVQARRRRQVSAAYRGQLLRLGATRLAIQRIMAWHRGPGGLSCAPSLGRAPRDRWRIPHPGCFLAVLIQKRSPTTSPACRGWPEHGLFPGSFAAGPTSPDRAA